MLRLMGALGACMLAGALVSTAAAHATTYYVATTGSNSNPGTESKPWKTVAHAVKTMVAGDTTYVRGGTYVEGLIRFSRSGTQAAPIKLLNHPGEAPIINFIDNVDFNAILIQSSGGRNGAMGWITIQGFEIRGGYVGIKFFSLHNSEIRNNWIHDNLHQGVLGGGGHHNVFDGNIVNHNGDFVNCVAGNHCHLSHGFYLGGNFYIVTNNLFYDNLAHGIQIAGAYSYNPATDPGPEFAGASDWVISHNTFAYQKYRAGLQVWNYMSDNHRIENNIFYENNVVGSTSASQGIDFTGNGQSGNQIRNNLFYASGSGGQVSIDPTATEGLEYTQSGNIINTLDPKFVNAPATLPPLPNFALKSGSPAIDKGLSPEQSLDSDKGLSPIQSPDSDKGLLFTWTRIDLKGTPRPQGPAPDIGAYEYRVDGDPHPPDRVQNVQIH